MRALVGGQEGRVVLLQGVSHARHVVLGGEVAHAREDLALPVDAAAHRVAPARHHLLVQAEQVQLALVHHRVRERLSVVAPPYSLVKLEDVLDELLLRAIVQWRAVGLVLDRAQHGVNLLLLALNLLGVLLKTGAGALALAVCRGLLGSAVVHEARASTQQGGAPVGLSGVTPPGRAGGGLRRHGAPDGERLRRHLAHFLDVLLVVVGIIVVLAPLVRLPQLEELLHQRRTNATHRHAVHRRDAAKGQHRGEVAARQLPQDLEQPVGNPEARLQYLRAVRDAEGAP
mmetsp:Transcript_6814/g.25152  ORF Transcript_6814/g.25152 Transcript_6814/m.25152 type:complete len:286 (-) Transcript_6814:1273-2130(-)